MVYLQWSLPTENLRLNYAEEIWLAPPQIYELSRLCGMRDYDELLKYTKEREHAGCERWFPVLVTCKDGIINTLPGMFTAYDRFTDWFWVRFSLS